MSTWYPLDQYLSSDSQTRKLEKLASQHWSSYTRAVTAIIETVLGTDLCLSKEKGYKDGMNASEFNWAVKAGLTPLQAVEEGTADPPRTLRENAPVRGQLRIGLEADFIGLDAKPLERFESLAETKRTRMYRGTKSV